MKIDTLLLVYLDKFRLRIKKKLFVCLFTTQSIVLFIRCFFFFVHIEKACVCMELLNILRYISCILKYIYPIFL